MNNRSWTKNRHFEDLLGGLFQLFLLGAIIYLLFLAIWGILKFIWFLFKLIWRLLTWAWSQIKKHAVLRYRIHRLKLAIQTFLSRHQRLNRMILSIRTYALMFYTSRPTELFNKLRKSA